MTLTETAPPSTETNKRLQQDIACEHCDLPVPKHCLEEAADFQFCCGGCRVAYEMIHGCGLEDYYRLRSQSAHDRQRASGVESQYTAYDTDSFRAKYATTTLVGLDAIELRLEGVHCAACVWLVEKLPHILPGVIESKLALASSRVNIVWDQATINLSHIAATLDKLGYAPHPARDKQGQQSRDAAERKRLVNLGIAGALAGNNMLIALALYAGVFDGIEDRFAQLFRWLSMGIGWASLAWPGSIFFRGAFASLRMRAANLDLPISIALGVGALAGTANVILRRGDIYFDSLSVLVFLLLVGRFIQTRQQRWAEDAIGLMICMTPATCHVVRDSTVVEEPIESLELGDEVETRPGDLFPADGTILSGQSTVDQSLLTGESLPQPVHEGDKVYSGAQNLDATLRISVTAVGEATRVGKLIQLVEQALHTKPPIVQLADRVAGWFVVIVVLLSVANFTAWSAISGIAPAIDTTVAMLIVACPCALGLATPLTMAVAIGHASKQGILIKSADVLERLGSIRQRYEQGRLILDKTGTLTVGKPRLVEWHGDSMVQPYVAAVEAGSRHPIATALRESLQSSQDHQPLVGRCIERHGYGVTAECDLGTIRVGSPNWMRSTGIESPESLSQAIVRSEREGLTAIGVAINDRLVAAASLADHVFEDAIESVQTLRSMGWSCEIASGDMSGTVQSVARHLDLQSASAHGQVTPEEKLELIRQAKRETDDTNLAIVMVGDGVNDAAALAAADVGIAVHGGAEAALTAADIYTSHPGVSSIVKIMEVAQRAMSTMRRNLIISLAYNTVAVGMAAAGLIAPLVAAILMPISSAAVLGSSIQGQIGRPRSTIQDRKQAD